jgi:competence protein ComEC
VERSPPRHPAVSFSLALLSGVVLGHCGLLTCSSIIPSGVGALAAIGWVTRRARRPVVVLAIVGSIALGVWAAGRERVDADLRTAGWIPADGSPIEIELTGRVLRAPELKVGGERSLRIVGRATDTPRGGIGPVRVGLTVRSSPPSEWERVEALRRGDRVRVWCRVRRPTPAPNSNRGDPRSSLLGRGLDLVGSVKSARLIERIDTGAPTPARVFDETAAWIRKRLDERFSGDHRTRTVVGAMMLGDREALSRRFRRTLRDAGLVHLIAISGLHVGLLILAVSGIVRRLPLSPWIASSATVAGLAWLPWVVGIRAPVARAVGGAVLGVCGRAAGRDGNPLNTLAAIAALLALHRPSWVVSPSLQLSFLATAGIVTLTGPISRSLPLPRWLAVSIAVTTAAYLATVPAVAWHYGRLAPVALIANLAAAPLCAVILTGATCSVVFHHVPFAADGGAWLAAWGVDTLDFVARSAASIPGAGWVVGRPEGWCVVAFYVLLAGLVCLRPLPGPPPARLRLLRLGLAILLVLIHVGPWPVRPAADLEIRVFDVGQGQSVMIRGSDGETVVVDAGPTAGGRFDTGERIVTPRLAALGVRRIDRLVLTHDHDDHAGGAWALLRNFEIGEVVVARSALVNRRTRALVREAGESGVPTVCVEQGSRLTTGALEILSLHPGRDLDGLDTNNRSLVVRLSRGELSVLIPGDLEAPGERVLLARGSDLRSEVLVAGHHGSRHGTTDEFLEAVAPEIVVVAAGRRNVFGHPHPETLARIHGSGTPALRTDLAGTITLDGDGRGWVQTTAPP